MIDRALAIPSELQIDINNEACYLLSMQGSFINGHLAAKDLLQNIYQASPIQRHYEQNIPLALAPIVHSLLKYKLAPVRGKKNAEDTLKADDAGVAFVEFAVQIRSKQTDRIPLLKTKNPLAWVTWKVASWEEAYIVNEMELQLHDKMKKISARALASVESDQKNISLILARTMT